MADLFGLEMKFAPLIQRAKSWYSFNASAKQYHNIEHATDVVLTVMGLREAQGRSASQELILAALYHDAVYVSGAGSDANERCSATALINDYKLLKAESNFLYFEDDDDDETIHRAAHMIRQTTVEDHLSDIPFSEITLDALLDDTLTLLDADLSGLAVPYVDFKHRQEAIILENHGDPESILHRQKSAEFLQQFLSVRPSIYRTDVAKYLLESKARSNIKRYLIENT